MFFFCFFFFFGDSIFITYVIVSLAAVDCAKDPQTGWLKPQKFISRSSGNQVARMVGF